MPKKKLYEELTSDEQTPPGSPTPVNPGVDVGAENQPSITLGSSKDTGKKKGGIIPKQERQQMQTEILNAMAAKKETNLYAGDEKSKASIFLKSLNQVLQQHGPKVSLKIGPYPYVADIFTPDFIKSLAAVSPGLTTEQLQKVLSPQSLFWNTNLHMNERTPEGAYKRLNEGDALQLGVEDALVALGLSNPKEPPKMGPSGGGKPAYKTPTDIAIPGQTP